MPVKECFGRVIADSGKLDECRGCEEREACQAVQWGDDYSGTGATVGKGSRLET
jgi:hypothetical protein